jgi:hypothetical protein
MVTVPVGTSVIPTGVGIPPTLGTVDIGIINRRTVSVGTVTHGRIRRKSPPYIGTRACARASVRECVRECVCVSVSVCVCVCVGVCGWVGE